MCPQGVPFAGAKSSVLCPHITALGLLLRYGEQTQAEAPTISPLLVVFLVGRVSGEGRSLPHCLFPEYRKHLGQDYTAISSLWEPGSEPGLCRRWKAFGSGSCTPPSVICSDGAEGVSMRHGNFFLPVSSINLHAKTQTLWNAPALQRAPASHSTWH